MRLTYFLLSFVLSAIITFVVILIMKSLRIVDSPALDERKIHRKKIPLGGGLAIVISFFLVMLFLRQDNLIGTIFNVRLIVGLCVGSIILMIGGIIDDRHVLSPYAQILFVAAASVCMVAAGLDFHAISNPFGEPFPLDHFVIQLGSLGSWAILADLAVFCWLSGMMITTKLLDGLDGLVTGMVTIGSLLLYFLSMANDAGQKEVGMVSLVFAGACLGFLLWNFYPAKVFLGQGGSLFTGFVLGTLAILSDGKVATTLLVMGIPILDVIRVIFLRMARHRSVLIGDKEHLHHQLLAAGLSQRQAVLLLYAIAFLFGITAVFLQHDNQSVAMLFLFVLLLLVFLRFARAEEKKFFL